MGTLLGFIPPMQFPVVIDLYQLWPAIVIAISIYFLRYITDYLLTPTAIRMTQRKIYISKPPWLTRNPITNNHNINHQKTTNGHSITTNDITLSVQNYNIILKLINKSTIQSINQLLEYGSDIQLSNTQIIQLKSYFLLIKSFDAQKLKYLEASFKLVTILPIAIFGFIVTIFKHNFFWNHHQQWIHYNDDIDHILEFNSAGICSLDHSQEPFIQRYDSWIKWYYIISSGYHLNRALFQFNNPSRRDFIALIIHHWTTLLLLICSWIGGKVRTGTIVMFLHENTDIFLEAAKICKYSSFQRGADIFFILFFVSWIVFRMYFFCIKLLYSIFTCGWYTCWIGDHLLPFPATCIALLYVLQGLHIYWFTMILKIVITLVTGGVIKDVRSGEEDNDESDKK